MISHPSQAEIYERFKAFHATPGGFIMPNAWDGGSALILFDAGLDWLEARGLNMKLPGSIFSLSTGFRSTVKRVSNEGP